MSSASQFDEDVETDYWRTPVDLYWSDQPKTAILYHADTTDTTKTLAAWLVDNGFSRGYAANQLTFKAGRGGREISKSCNILNPATSLWNGERDVRTGGELTIVPSGVPTLTNYQHQVPCSPAQHRQDQLRKIHAVKAAVVAKLPKETKEFVQAATTDQLVALRDALTNAIRLRTVNEALRACTRKEFSAEQTAWLRGATLQSLTMRQASAGVAIITFPPPSSTVSSAAASAATAAAAPSATTSTVPPAAVSSIDSFDGSTGALPAFLDPSSPAAASTLIFEWSHASGPHPDYRAHECKHTWTVWSPVDGQVMFVCNAIRVGEQDRDDYTRVSERMMEWLRLHGLVEQLTDGSSRPTDSSEDAAEQEAEDYAAAEEEHAMRCFLVSIYDCIEHGAAECGCDMFDLLEALDEPISRGDNWQ